MNRKGFAMLLFISVVLCGYAREISEGEAMRVAESFLNKGTLRKSPLKPGQESPATQSVEHQPYYIFNAGNENGFVIVSGDDRAKKILGYSDKGSFDSNNIPPQLSWLLGEYAAQINSLPSSAPTDPSWNESTTSRAANEVLLETANWGQGAPYNDMCPVINGEKCLTGCVATAMAIVMKYHNWPPTTHGEEHINFHHKDTIVDFSNRHINWTETVDDPQTETEKQAVSYLMYLIGNAIDTKYGINESEASMWNMNHELITTFSYSSTCHHLTRNHYTFQEWNEIITNQLNNGNPILYGGRGTDAHVFVLDGFNSYNLYHINWGWDGLHNGYFALDSFSPDNNDFNFDQTMIVNVIPEKSNSNYKYSPIHFFYGWNTSFTTPNYNCSQKDINRGDIISICGPVYSFPKYSGELRFALFDENNNILEFSENTMFNWSSPYDGSITTHASDFIQGSDWYINQYQDGWYSREAIDLYPYDIQGRFCFKNTNIKPEYKIGVVSKAEGEQDWKIVLGLNNGSPFIPVRNNNSKWTDIDWVYDSNYVSILYAYSPCVGENLSHVLTFGERRYQLLYDNGTIEVFIDGKSVNGLDNIDLGQFVLGIPGEEPSTLYFHPQKSHHKIEICYTPATRIDVTSMTLDCAELTLNVNETATLTAAVLPENATDKTIIWSSANENVATVDENGAVTAIEIGETNITASCGKVSAQCKVSVIDISGIESNIIDDYTYSVYNLTGICVKSECKGTEFNTLPSGIYILRFDNGKTRKIVIK